MRPILPNMQLNERQNKLLASQVEHENLLGSQMCSSRSRYDKVYANNYLNFLIYIHLYSSKNDSNQTNKKNEKLDSGHNI